VAREKRSRQPCFGGCTSNKACNTHENIISPVVKSAIRLGDINMRFTIWLALWLVATCALPAAVLAETAYVTDNLRLGLHLAPDTSDRAFRTLDSGQTVEILSRDRNFAQVQLPDGATGYLKAAYLVFERPAKLIVAETQAENDRLARELAETKQAFAGPAATIDALESDVAQHKAALDESTAKIEELTEENDRYRRRQGGYKYSMPFPWVAGALGVSLLAGFLLGLWTVDYRSRRRHGGVRIY
jgi:SH3 domain protein